MSHENGQAIGQPPMPDGISNEGQTIGTSEPTNSSIQPLQPFTFIDSQPVVGMDRRQFLINMAGLVAGTAFLPIGFASGRPPAETTATPTPTLTAEPSPTNTPEPSQTPEIQQGPISIKADARVALAYSAQPYWSRADSLDSDGDIQAELVGFFPNETGDATQYVVDIGGKRGQIDSAAVVDPNQIVKVELADMESVEEQTHVIIDTDHPFVVTQYMGHNFPDGFIMSPANQKNQQIVFKINADAGTYSGKIAEDFYNNVFVWGGKTSLNLAYRNDGSSFLIIYATQPNNTAGAVYRKDIGDINNMPLQIIVHESRKKFKLINEDTQLPLYSSLDEEEGWIEIPDNGELGGDVISVGFAGSVTTANNMTVNNISVHSKTVDTGKYEPQVFAPEMEVGNGLSRYSDSEGISIGSAIDILSTPGISNLIKENAVRVDFNHSLTFSARWMADPENGLQLHSAHKTQIAWMRANNIKFSPAFNAFEVPEHAENRQAMSEYISVLTDINPGQSLPIADLFDAQTGDIRKDLVWANNNYGKNGGNFARDVVRRINERHGAAAQFVVPKGNMMAQDRIFDTIQSIRTEHSVDGVYLDVGALNRSEAINLIRRYQTKGIQVIMDQVADNVDGLTLEDLIKISIDTSIERVMGTPEQRDEKKRYAIESVDNQRTRQFNYTPVYDQYRKLLSEIVALKDRRPVEKEQNLPM